MLRAGVVIAGKYRILRKLGEGAMGSVWLARSSTTDREFAIKVLLPDAAGAPDALARFFREAKICGGLRHPSILEIYDAGPAPELGGAPFLVMERLDGAPLDVILAQRGALPPPVAIEIVAHLARGLELAHQKGIVHRDLKPANVFLHRPGTGALEPKVLDFGISKMIDPTSAQVALTHTAAIMGSPLYMSPEQMDHGKGLDARSDIHALGLLLWECLVGRAPFAGVNYNLLVIEIMKGPRPKLRDVMPSASERLAEIVERAFAIERDARFASAADLAEALEAELASLGGGVLGARTAAAEILRGLDGNSKAPPAMQGGTTGQPLSIDAVSQSPAARSVSIDSAGLSFAQTEEMPSAVAVLPRPPVVAVSAQRQAPRASPSRVPLMAGAAAFLAVLILGVGGWFALSRPAASSARRDEVPVTSSVAVGSAGPPASASAEAPPEVLSAPLPSASASVARALPSRAPAATAIAKTAPSHPNPPPSASTSTGRPRIDQSGL